MNIIMITNNMYKFLVIHKSTNENKKMIPNI